MKRGTKAALVIGRRRPGRPIDEVVRETSRALVAAGWSVDARVVNGKSALRRRAGRAVKREVAMVVVVGGDGAVGQVVTAMAGSDVALGVVPTGTGNLFAGNLGVPTDRAKAIKTLLAGHRRRIDVGRVRVGGRRRAFTIACGVGFDAEVMDDTSTKQKVQWGQVAYLATAIARAASLHAVPHRLTIDGDEVKLDAAQVFVANMGRMLPLVEPRLPVLPDDGLLDVIAITASGPAPAALAGWEALRQEELGVSSGGRVFRARAKRVRVDASPPRRVEVDGSAVGSTPLDAEVVPGGLCVLVPGP